MPRLSKIGAAALAAFGWTGLSSVTADVLVVAGGGGGGNGNGGGGGGAGGYRTGTTSLNPTLSYTVTVGAGGVGGPGSGATPPTKGGNSVFSTITSTGGGRGGGSSNAAYTAGNGGSGGGGSAYLSATKGTGNEGGFSPVEGFDGADGVSNPTTGRSGGGGGSSAVGLTAASSGVTGAGGAGTPLSISGSSVTYAVGGTSGSFTGTETPSAGAANTGNGGGGGSNGAPYSGVSGGSGIVIISYVGAQQFGGGVVTSSGGNTIHTFTTSGTLSPLSSLTASCLVLAGGGGGGSLLGGGGGAGGYRTGSGITIDINSIYAITVGAGGAGAIASGNGLLVGSKGGSSTFLAITSAGGGEGGSNNATVEGQFGGGGSGGSGGGAGPRGSISAAAGNTPSTSPSQGNNGGIQGSFTVNGGSGGGGASAVGGNLSGTAAGSGGAGTANSISGSSVTYAGGGGGGGRASLGGTAGSGGAGGGGSGTADNSNGGAGTNGLGGGGGGGGFNGTEPGGGGGNGGSGIVIISYPGSTQQMAGGTVTVAGGNVIHTFTSSGYLTPIVLVNNSLRFRASATAYLNRTGSTATNAQKATYSFWMKRGTLTTGQWIFTGGASSATTLVGFNGSSDALSVLLTDVSGEGNITAAVFRDPSAWYHVVIAIDTTQATTADRAKIYVNGVLQTVTVANGGIGLNANWGFNTANTLNIGRYGPSASSYFDGYLADVNFIDGQTLTPNSFGTSNGLGVWQPIRYGGSYGTNGFYLPFINNATGTSLSANFLVVAGGAGGGEYWSGGGGGAGGLRSSVTNTGGGGTLESALTINTNSTYLVTVGGGGPGAATGGSDTKGANGSNSVFSTITSTGGGAGGIYNNFNGNSGGSGGGGFYGGSGAAGTANQGFAGGNGATSGFGNESGGGGGGGAGAVGAAGAYAVGGNGGAGVSVSITGSSVPYAGGGGGSVYTGTGGTGGSGGGADGVANGGGNGKNGSPNTGGGASGTATYPLAGGNGGSGVVIISYSGDAKFTGGTITRSGGNTIHTFTSSGVLTSVFSDYSPNGNNWTGNNFNVTTSGSTYDSMTDVPTLTSATAANYCVMSPIASSPLISLTNGNLTAGGTDEASLIGTIGVNSGKWYWEVTVTSGSVTPYLGVSSNSFDKSGVGTNFRLAGISWYGNGNKKAYTATSETSATSNTTGVYGFALDISAGTLAFYFNNSLVLTDTTIPTSGVTLFPLVAHTNSGSNSWNPANFNFGQQPFAYTPPTGFVALNTFNLTTPTIGATASTTANKYFNAVTYAGAGAGTVITTGFYPDFAWMKNRTAAFSNFVQDSVRGGGVYLLTDEPDPDAAVSPSSTFSSTGLTIPFNSSYASNSSYNFVAWAWNANSGSTVSNTAGSITSTVSANTTAGFSIVTYTGTGGTGTTTVGHGCQVGGIATAPSMVIIKRRNASANWATYHTGLTSTSYYLFFDVNTGEANYGSTFISPSSSTLTIAADSSLLNASGGTYVAYCFAQVAGYSAFGSYTGNGSTNGTFVYTGFRPRFIILKHRGAGSDAWILMDTSTQTYNVVGNFLQPSQPDQELYAVICDFLSNGFKLRETYTTINTGSNTYIYMAFAENPFKYANAR